MVQTSKIPTQRVTKTLLCLLISAVTLPSAAALSPLAQNVVFNATDRIVAASQNNADKIKQSIILIKEHLETNYLPLSQVEVREAVVKELVPYMQCPAVECTSPSLACEYSNPIRDERGCQVSCGELSCSCDTVACYPLPDNCSYVNQQRDAQECLTGCGEVSCQCEIQECPTDGCYEAISDKYGCISQCRPTECPQA